MIKKAATPHDLTATTVELKYGQMEILPFVDKYNLPVWFVIVLVSFVALKQLGLIYFVKDIWAWFGAVFNQKNIQIASLNKELHEVREEMEVMHQKHRTDMEAIQGKYQDMSIKYNSVTSILKGLRPHFRSIGMDLEELDKLFNP